MREAISVLDKKVNLYKRGRSNKWQAAIKLKNGKWERFLLALTMKLKPKKSTKAILWRRS